MVELQQQALPDKPSFISSVASGILGYVKGALTGGIAGAAAGAIIGALVGSVLFAMAPAAGAITIAVFAGKGAVMGGTALAALGAVAGAMTGVISSREAGQPSAEDVVNVAKISFAQGVSAGHKMQQNQAAAHTNTTGHATKIAAERTAVAMAESQITH